MRIIYQRSIDQLRFLIKWISQYFSGKNQLEYIYIVKLLYTASLPKLLAQFLATVIQERWLKPALAPIHIHPNLLYKPILIAYPYLDRPIRISVLLGYTDSVVDKVLILPLKQVHQELEPSKGVRFLESSVTAIIYHALQLYCFALPITFLR